MGPFTHAGFGNARTKCSKISALNLPISNLLCPKDASTLGSEQVEIFYITLAVGDLPRGASIIGSLQNQNAPLQPQLMNHFQSSQNFPLNTQTPSNSPLNYPNEFGSPFGPSSPPSGTGMLTRCPSSYSMYNDNNRPWMNQI